MVELLQTYSPDLILGFRNTLYSSVIALVFSLIIGTLLGILQVSNNRFLKIIATAYVEFFRNIPLLVIVMFFYVVIPLYLFQIDGLTAGIIGLTIYTSSFIADVIRSGIMSVPRGQFEAGYSQGLGFAGVMRYIVLPQALKIVIPPLGNQFINLVKNSSVLAMVAGLDLMYYGDLIASETFNTFDTYILVALFYLLLTVPLTYLMSHVEKRFASKA
ncbi:amino acid abc transporter permease protein 3-tm domain [Trichococcus palustris]|jgi:aspartate/glutamate/glutamine transport system permease protein|uniref:Amino acid abc transporter permease protein 3-tm domain n=1 Tax=Trichococcus palustris TaxID=140314 RepID=A0A143YJU4_9LACT|nr:amino acid ABC transporter permease [Trichococcus palustris]CZQ90394.1 amino acid abc transporter permease protein 3-tm domain [Trichococcus palustris]SFL11826.1 putative glutamine transport system permease protein [Trichococcus palustris]